MGSNCNNGNNKEGRWAEQLLNPCASAMTTGNLTRIQHLLYVLHELASPSGDANHRLAAHGLRALTQHLSSSPTSTLSPPPINYASTEPRLFQQALLKFNEVSPWFAFTNTIANASIIQVLAKEPNYSKNVHILDIGVSHGLQWPTLFEALSRRAGGPPPLLRLTIIAETAQNSSAPFSTGPSGDDYPSILLRFAKSYNLNFQINLIKNQSLQTLTPQIINASKDDNETLIICAQFRLHHLNHTTPDDHRTNFIKTLKDLHPKALILCDNDMECSCIQCSDFATGFARKVDYLWKFLDSTSAAFKGRECEFRRIVEGEAAMALVNRGELNEAKDKWCERIGGVGFSGEGFGEDAIDGGRALLRKYDSNWEMRVDEKDGFARLWWKGQPVSFCSLWTLEKKAVSDS
ncbi:hypothetical protein GIB67_024062 [Kingdonia uniflora]|uniref:Nodulation signaling pathway 1-like protein n=1 Tax=Kingdonia uniflora TaxID=39325 RepID=A0A7J7LUT4_9MAGN|nr:hypothetical protein GIB67_024062 [Kingdonia uniflora]